MHYGMLLSDNHKQHQPLPDHLVIASCDESAWTWLMRHLHLALHRLTQR